MSYPAKFERFFGNIILLMVKSVNIFKTTYDGNKKSYLIASILPVTIQFFTGKK